MSLAFWVLLFVIYPLVLDPIAFSFGAGGERAVLLPKALLLGITWGVGFLALLASFPTISLKTFVTSLPRWPLPLQVMLALTLFLLVNSWLAPGDVAVNIIGSQSRVDGFLLQAAWYGLCLIAAWLVVARADAYKNAVNMLYIGALLTSLWTLAQFYGFEPVALISPTPYLQAYNPQNIAYGPMALTGLTAGYLAVVLVVYIASQKRYTWCAVLYVSIVSAAVIATGNRTAPAAVIVVLVAWALSHAWQRNISTLRRLIFFGLLLVVSVVVVQTTRSQIPEQFTRTQNLIQGEDTSWQLRLILWQTAALGAFDQPLTGLGTRGFGHVLWHYLTPEQRDAVASMKLPAEATDIRYMGGSFFRYQMPEQEEVIFNRVLIDKAHNYILDFMIANGWLATLLFATALVSGVIVLSTASLDTQAIALGISVYLLFGLTWFATLQVDPIIWGLFGIGIGSALHTSSDASKPIGDTTTREIKTVL
ncbi:MAG: O-antigen ligase family protein [Deinococcota bacterium]